jgi:hypothetical protein
MNISTGVERSGVRWATGKPCASSQTRRFNSST